MKHCELKWKQFYLALWMPDNECKWKNSVLSILTQKFLSVRADRNDRFWFTLAFWTCCQSHSSQSEYTSEKTERVEADDAAFSDRQLYNRLVVDWEKMLVYMIKTAARKQQVQPVCSLIYNDLPTLKTDFTGASLCDLGASNNTKAD